MKSFIALCVLSFIVYVNCKSIASLVPPTPAGFTWSSCGTAKDHFKIDSLVMVPYPPVRGQNVTVHAYGTQDETVSGGHWSTSVYWDGINVQTVSGKTCDLIPNCPCPCAAGTYTTSQTTVVSDLAPSGSYTGNFIAKDQNKQQMSCVNYAFQL